MAVIDHEFLSNTALAGVDETNLDGTPFDESLFTHAIDYAQGYVSRRLDVPLGGADYLSFTERRSVSYGGSARFRMNRAPIREITEVKSKLGTLDVFILPEEWVDVLDAETGDVQLVPVSGSVTGVALQTYYFLMQAGFVRHGTHGQFEFTYTAGFKADDCPAEIKELIACHAANKLLQQFGDILYGQAGVASQNISMDGLSQGFSSTASAMYSGYSAQMDRNDKRIEQLEEVLEDTLRGIYIEAV